MELLTLNEVDGDFFVYDKIKDIYTDIFGLGLIYKFDENNQAIFRYSCNIHTGDVKFINIIICK